MCRYASPEHTAAGALVTLNAVTSNKKPKGDSTAYITPVQSPRGVAGDGLGLPSHISVFGDDQPDEDDACMGGVRLPSHISAFGDGDEDDLACAVKGLKGTAHLHPLGAGSGFGVQHVAGAGECVHGGPLHSLMSCEVFVRVNSASCNRAM